MRNFSLIKSVIQNNVHQEFLRGGPGLYIGYNSEFFELGASHFSNSSDCLAQGKTEGGESKSEDQCQGDVEDA